MKSKPALPNREFPTKNPEPIKEEDYFDFSEYQRPPRKHQFSKETLNDGAWLQSRNAATSSRFRTPITISRLKEEHFEDERTHLQINEHAPYSSQNQNQYEKSGKSTSPITPRRLSVRQNQEYCKASPYEDGEIFYPTNNKSQISFNKKDNQELDQLTMEVDDNPQGYFPEEMEICDQQDEDYEDYSHWNRPQRKEIESRFAKPNNNNNTDFRKLNKRTKRNPDQIPTLKIKRPPNSSAADWTCPACSNINFAKRISCNVCNMPKPYFEILKTPISQLGPEGLFKDTDWQCFNCRNVNFQRRAFCNKCNEPKPEEYIQREQEMKKQFKKKKKTKKIKNGCTTQQKIHPSNFNKMIKSNSNKL